jgi:hypothetical protein
MTKRYLVIATAWLLHAASWFLPAIKGFLGSRLDHGIPGWAVFLSQTCALRPCGVASADPWYGTAISAGGAVTTVLFVLASPGLYGAHRASFAWRQHSWQPRLLSLTVSGTYSTYQSGLISELDTSSGVPLLACLR